MAWPQYIPRLLMMSFCLIILRFDLCKVTDCAWTQCNCRAFALLTAPMEAVLHVHDGLEHYLCRSELISFWRSPLKVTQAGLREYPLFDWDTRIDNTANARKRTAFLAPLTRRTEKSKCKEGIKSFHIMTITSFPRCLLTFALDHFPHV